MQHESQHSIPPPMDTIAAIATAPGVAAISIVRLSGPDSFNIADRLLRCPALPPSARSAGTFAYAQVLDPLTQEIIDDAVVLFFRAPHSYTGEDGIEIQCHGGTQSARRILAALLASGARQAEPGEFTKRAFLNDRLDLSQAESVLDLIHARSERAARIALAQLHHAVSDRVEAIYNRTLQCLADMEAMLDFPDDELPQLVPQEIITRLEELKIDLQILLDTWHEGKLLREGARVVIAGAPNAGKSTLLNRLVGHDRAIVSPHPGTTRDILEDTIVLDGIPIHVADTAGIRDTEHVIEQEGVRRTHDQLSKADLCIYVLDASIPIPDAEREFLTEQLTRPTLLILNKTDLGEVIFPSHFSQTHSLSISLKNNPSLHVIQDAIKKEILDSSVFSDSAPIAISERHKNILSIAKEEIVKSLAFMKMDEEGQWILSASHLQEAMRQLGTIMGKNCSEDVLDAIFSRFCVGK